MGPEGVTVTKTPGVVVIKVAIGVSGRSVPVGVVVGVVVVVGVTEAVAVKDGIGVAVPVWEGTGVCEGTGVSVGGGNGVFVGVNVGPGVGVSRGGWGVAVGAGVAVARTSTLGKTTIVTAPSFTVIWRVWSPVGSYPSTFSWRKRYCPGCTSPVSKQKKPSLLLDWREARGISPPIGSAWSPILFRLCPVDRYCSHQQIHSPQSHKAAFGGGGRHRR
jgi:hypothetical protein